MAYTIYDPRLCTNNNQYKVKYPSLREYEALDVLHPDWLVFVWWFSCQASPLVVTPMSHIKRAELAITKSGLVHKTNDINVQNALNGQFTDDVKSAIAVMGSFNADLRTESWLIAKDMFEGIKQSVDKNNFAKKNDDGEIVSYNQDDYMAACTKASKMLPDIVKQLENTYGVVEVDDSMLTLGADTIAEQFFTNKRHN